MREYVGPTAKVRLPKEMREELELLAALRDESLAGVIRSACVAFIAEQRTEAAT